MDAKERYLSGISYEVKVETAGPEDEIAGLNIEGLSFIRVHTLDGAVRVAPDPNCPPIEGAP